MLKRIYIHNFRTFVNFEWAPPRSCALVGDNGAGKSAFIEVLCLLQDLVVQGRNVNDTLSPSARTAWRGDARQSVEIDFLAEGELFTYRLDIDQQAGQGEVHEELRSAGGVLYRAEAGKVELFGDSPSAEPRTTIPFHRRGSFLSVLEPRADNKKLMTFREAIRGIWAMKPDPRRLGSAATSETNSLDRDLGNFANWYRARMQEDPDAAEVLRDDLRRVIPGFSTLPLEPLSAEVKDLRARFAFGDRTYELAWAKLSDGQRLLIAMYGMLRLGLAPATLIALDECENYVAPREIQPWLRAVADAAAERKQQLLVVSHHPELINYLAAESAWRMWRDKDAGHTRIARLAPDLEAGEAAYDSMKFALSLGPSVAAGDG